MHETISNPTFIAAIRRLAAAFHAPFSHPVFLRNNRFSAADERNFYRPVFVHFSYMYAYVLTCHSVCYRATRPIVETARTPPTKKDRRRTFGLDKIRQINKKVR